MKTRPVVALTAMMLSCLAPLVLAGACTPSGPEAAPSPEERAEVGQMPLDGGCALCAAQALFGDCAAQVADCTADDQCVADNACLDTCDIGDVDCLAGCADAGGPLQDLVACVLCDACAADCDAADQCNGMDPGDDQDPPDVDQGDDPPDTDPGDDPGDDPQTDPVDDPDPGDCAACGADALDNECSLEGEICDAVDGCMDVLACAGGCGADLDCVEGCLDAADWAAGAAAENALSCIACDVCADACGDVCCDG